MICTTDFKVVMASLDYAPNNQEAFKSLQRIADVNSDLLEAAKGALKVLNPATAGVFYENLKAAIAKAESR